MTDRPWMVASRLCLGQSITAFVGSTAPSTGRANHGGNASHETNHGCLFPADGSGKLHAETHAKSMGGQKWREAA